MFRQHTFPPRQLEPLAVQGGRQGDPARPLPPAPLEDTQATELQGARSVSRRELACAAQGGVKSSQRQEHPQASFPRPAPRPAWGQRDLGVTSVPAAPARQEGRWRNGAVGTQPGAWWVAGHLSPRGGRPLGSGTSGRGGGPAPARGARGFSGATQPGPAAPSVHRGAKCLLKPGCP